jgi:hypothetical protein
MATDINYVIDTAHYSPPNLLGEPENLRETLELEANRETRFYPLALEQIPLAGYTIKGAGLIFLGHDREYDILSRVLGTKQGAHNLCNHVLNATNTEEDVRFRQSAVRELTENRRAYEYVGRILEKMDAFSGSETWRELNEYYVRCCMNPEKFAEFVAGCKELGRANIRSRPLERLVSWADKMMGDTLFRELVRQKREATDRRVFAVFSERYGGVRYGILRPCVKPEEVFDFLSSSASEVVIQGTRKDRARRVVKFKSFRDEEAATLVVSHARQRIDVLNDATSRLFALPAYLAYIQLQHLFQGAYLHNLLRDKGYPSTFPEFSEKSRDLEVRDLLPIRLVFQEILDFRRFRKGRLCPQNFKFDHSLQVAEAEGPNWRGKSEAWRSLHLFYALFNSGYAVPASYACSGLIPGSRFISFKGSSGTGGSEFWLGVKPALEELSETCPGGQIVLDELGDATNAPTAAEFAARLLPPLIKRGDRILITSHHGALTSFVEKRTPGEIFVPDPFGKRAGKFRLVGKRGEVDYRAGETLDGMGLTNAKLKTRLKRGKRSKPPILIARTDKEMGKDDDSPF